MAVKLAVGLGADVTVIRRTRDKEADALELGADRLLVSSDEEAMAELQSGFELIIDTVLVQHEVNPYVSLLDVDGALVMVGYFVPLPDADTTPLLFGRRTIMGTPVGSLAETQELLDFCSKKNILPECEMIRMDQINEAFERMEKSDVRSRLVIDMRTLEG
jgi:alcohol dehydrogenase (NADP+)